MRRIGDRVEACPFSYPVHVVKQYYVAYWLRRPSRE
jgi:hypothetical protein